MVPVHLKSMVPAAAPIEASPICWICGEVKALPWKERPLGAEDLRITDSRYGTTLGLWLDRLVAPTAPTR